MAASFLTKSFLSALLGLGLALASGGGAGAASRSAAAHPMRPGGGFDFYVLSLTWAPSYCERAGARANKTECGKAAHFGFIAHGLWPQYEHGYPENCRSSQPRRVSEDIFAKMRDIMPSPGLIIHEWRTHGMCTGMTQSDYFATLRKAYGAVNIPQELSHRAAGGGMSTSAIETAFVKANPGLSADGVSVDCQGKYLSDVRICMTKDFNFRSCPEVERETCRASTVLVPATH